MIKPKTPNSMEIAGQPAVINYVPELNAFRGKFPGIIRILRFCFR